MGENLLVNRMGFILSNHPIQPQQIVEASFGLAKSWIQVAIYRIALLHEVNQTRQNSSHYIENHPFGGVRAVLSADLLITWLKKFFQISRFFYFSEKEGKTGMRAWCPWFYFWSIKENIDFHCCNFSEHTWLHAMHATFPRRRKELFNGMMVTISDAIVGVIRVSLTRINATKERPKD